MYEVPAHFDASCSSARTTDPWGTLMGSNSMGTLSTASSSSDATLGDENAVLKHLGEKAVIRLHNMKKALMEKT